VLAGLVGSTLLAVMLAGCQHGPSQVGSSDVPVIPVAQPVTREVTPYVDFTGRTDAVESVNIVPRVTGYLVERPFQEGS
jgi:multidrug efflux pump subunit AcrA (membrane-fusion protein)